MATNAFASGLYVTSSYVNHSCKHNAIAVWDAMELKHSTPDGKMRQVKITCQTCDFKDPGKNRCHFMTIRPLAKGEEITINYFAQHPHLFEKTKIHGNHCNLTVPLRDLYPVKRKRRKMLFDKFGFWCLCSECQ